jgi:uncharacterized membrane protein YoaK (UPF0700 family)
MTSRPRRSTLRLVEEMRTRPRITLSDWLGRWSWIVSVVAAIFGVLAIFFAHNALLVATFFAVAVIYLVLPPFKRRMRAMEATYRRQADERKQSGEN